MNCTVAIVGGGVAGISVAYALQKLGWSNIAVFEQDELTSGSTWHSAGHLSLASDCSHLSAISQRSLQIFYELADGGIDVGFFQCGGVKVAGDAIEIDGIIRQKKICENLGISTELRPLSEFDAVQYVLAPNAIYGYYGLLVHDDGHIDPHRLCMAMASLSSQNGVTFHRYSKIRSLMYHEKSGWKLVAGLDSVWAKHVVVCAGSGSNRLLATIGIQLLYRTYLHNYFIVADGYLSDGVEIPIIRSSHMGGYLRQYGSGLILGTSEATSCTVVDRQEEGRHSNQLYELDSDEISDNLELVMRSLLDPDRICIQKHVRGQIPYTPDGNMLLGKLSQQGLENLWISTGLSSGISQGPGAGMALAEMMTYGSSDIAVNCFNVERFGLLDEVELSYKTRAAFLGRGKLN